MTKIVYIDESGNSNLVKPDKGFPVFGLGGVVIDKTKVPEIDAQVKALKHKFFNSAEVIFHMSEMTKNISGFHRVVETDFRNNLYSELAELINSLDMDFSYALTEVASLSKSLRDCYTLTLENLIDKVLDSEQETDRLVIVESGDKGLNRKIMLGWEAIRIFGTRKNSARKISKKITSFDLKPKQDNIIGLQLCDLLISQVTRAHLGLEVKIRCKHTQIKKEPPPHTQE